MRGWPRTSGEDCIETWTNEQLLFSNDKTIFLIQSVMVFGTCISETFLVIAYGVHKRAPHYRINSPALNPRLAGLGLTGSLTRDTHVANLEVLLLRDTFNLVDRAPEIPSKPTSSDHLRLHYEPLPTVFDIRTQIRSMVTAPNPTFVPASQSLKALDESHLSQSPATVVLTVDLTVVIQLRSKPLTSQPVNLQNYRSQRLLSL